MRMATLTLTALLVVLALVAESGAASAEGAGASLLPGDFTCDDASNSIDVLVILQFAAGVTPHPECKSLADLSGDGRTNAIDAALLLQVDAGLVSYVKRDGNLARGKRPDCVLLTLNDAKSIQIIGSVPEIEPPGHFLRVRGFYVTPDKGCADEALRIFSSTFLVYI